MAERPRASARGRAALDHDHRAPDSCPVCGDPLAVTRLGCGSCGTELAGIFPQCEFCTLSDTEIELLRVFLASRGNLREVERFLGVSYPTARQRYTDLMGKLGLSGEPEPESLTREQVLAEVAAGALTPDEATRLIAELPG